MDKLVAEQKRLKTRCAWLCEEINCLTTEIDHCVACADDTDAHALGPGMEDMYSERAARERELEDAKAHVGKVEKELSQIKKPKPKVKKAVKKP